MDGHVRRSAHRKPSLGLVGLMITALIAAGCLADDPLGMTYEIGACDLQKASVASPSVLAAYEPSDAEATHDESMNMTDDATAIHDEAMHDDAVHDEAVHTDEAPAHDLAGTDVDWLVTITVDEFSFGCALPDMKAGSVVAIRFGNVGSMAHEAVVGPLDIQDRAELEMAEMADMGSDSMEEMHHEFPSVALPPGEVHVLVVQLDDPGVAYVGCHVPGHWDAGMQMPFRVV